MNGSIKKLLAGSEPFSSLPKEEIQRLAGHVSRKRIEAGTLLAHQNKSGVDGVYLIESGLIELYYEQNGGKILSGYLKPGELFGGISILMNGGIALRTVRVEKTAACMRIPKSEFLNLCTRFHTFNEYFVDTFSKRMLDESYAAIVSASQAFLFLSGVVPFSFLPEEELERVAAELAIVHYPKDTLMAVQGQTRIEYLYIIQRGAVERYYEEDEKKSLRGIIGEGDVYGGIALLLNDGISVRTLSTQEIPISTSCPGSVFWTSAVAITYFPIISPTPSANGCWTNPMLRLSSEPLSHKWTRHPFSTSRCPRCTPTISSPAPQNPRSRALLWK
ncbi:hypothetical protein D3OALGA1CA_4803 [Olavius algarvensis associated proteobacterium Delta 3]|nr:hypothetical protein D3OALGA1CA_4803 [Olavius algarvensis associated proteobacterium Delta 3]